MPSPFASAAREIHRQVRLRIRKRHQAILARVEQPLDNQRWHRDDRHHDVRQLTHPRRSFSPARRLNGVREIRQFVFAQRQILIVARDPVITRPEPQKTQHVFRQFPVVRALRAKIHPSPLGRLGERQPRLRQLAPHQNMQRRHIEPRQQLHILAAIDLQPRRHHRRVELPFRNLPHRIFKTLGRHDLHQEAIRAIRSPGTPRFQTAAPPPTPPPTAPSLPRPVATSRAKHRSHIRSSPPQARSENKSGHDAAPAISTRFAPSFFTPTHPP